MNKILIKYHSDSITKIKKISIGDWIDLRTAEDITLEQGELKLISLGVSMKLPEGYEANIVPRSSTAKKYKILQANHYGVIDNSYSGNDDIWKFSAIAIRDTTIKANSRICQFRLNRIAAPIKFVEVDSLDDVNRGGFGSTNNDEFNGDVL